MSISTKEPTKKRVAIKPVTLEMLRYFLESRGYGFRVVVHVDESAGVRIIDTEEDAQMVLDYLRKRQT